MPVDQPLPLALIGHWRLVSGRLLIGHGQFDCRPALPADAIVTAIGASEPPPGGSQAIVPTFALKQPPQGIAAEYLGATAPPAGHPDIGMEQRAVDDVAIGPVILLTRNPAERRPPVSIFH